MSQSFIHQVRILSQGKGGERRRGRWARRRNPLFIKSEFSRHLWTAEVHNWVVSKSQSFIHQVRILSLLDDFADHKCIDFADCRNPLFIKSEFSQECCQCNIGHLPASRNPLFIKSEFSPVEFRLHQGTTNPESQSFIHQVRILSGVPGW